MAFNKDDIIAQLKEASLVELTELVKAVEEEFGVSAVVAAAPAAAEDAGPKNFTVKLAEVGGSKLGVIKAVREITGLGLKEAKEVVDNAPSDIATDVPEAQATEWKEKLEAAGAVVELV